MCTVGGKRPAGNMHAKASNHTMEGNLEGLQWGGEGHVHRGMACAQQGDHKLPQEGNIAW
jgi:hypothetical protein